MNALDIGIIAAYFLGMLIIGVYAGKKQRGFDDYFLGGRSMGAWTLGCLWMAGWIGGSSVSGTASNGYSMGITAVWYVFSLAIGLLIFGFTMTKPIKRVGDKLNNITIPDFLEARYDSKTRLAATISIFIATIGFVASQFVVGASALSVMTGWDLGKCYIITAVTITLYVAAGGLLAVTYTDAIQMILLLGGVVIIGVPLTISAVNSTGQTLAEALPPEYFDLGARGWENILALAVSSGISFFTMMDSYTRCISAKSAKAARNGTIVAAVAVVFIALSCTYLGMATKVLLPDSVNDNDALPALIIHVFPHGVKGLVLVGILSAVMSTADISILMASTNVVKDVYMRYVDPEFNEKKSAYMGFAVALAVGAAACWFGWYSNDVVSILLLTYTVNSAGLFLPIICAFFWKRACSNAAFCSIVSAAIVIAVWYICGITTDMPLFKVSSLWPALIVSGTAFLLISLRHRQTEGELAKAERFIAIANKD